MKNAVLISLFASGFLTLASTASAQSGLPARFRIEGSVNKLAVKVKWVYLSYQMGQELYRDSVRVRHGAYSFKGEINEPTLARLYFRELKFVNGRAVVLNLPRNSAELFLVPGTNRVEHADSFSHIEVPGSPAQADYETLARSTRPYESEMADIDRSYGSLDPKRDGAARDSLVGRYKIVDSLYKEKYRSFLESHPGSPVAVYALTQFAGYNIDPVRVGPLWDRLPDSLKAYPSARDLAEKLELARKTAIGQPAMDFEQSDTAGHPVRLSSFRGKYVLVDFWASWCGPCRQESPNLVKAYRDYHPKGLFIIGVSLDRPAGKDAWLKAIHQDSLYWTQVSDLKYWKNEIAVQYGIQSIPQNLLIDPHGVIIAKNLRGKALENKLSAIWGRH